MGAGILELTADFSNAVGIAKKLVGEYGKVSTPAGEVDTLLEIAEKLSKDRVFKATKALLDADLDHDEDIMAEVTADATADNNRLYIKVGASGSGSWEPCSLDRVDAVNEVAGRSKQLSRRIDPRYLSGVATKYQNAFRGLNTPDDVVPNCISGIYSPEETFQKVVNHDFMDKYGEYCLQVIGTGEAYRPSLSLLVSPEDLARIGVVPDDATPPKISFMLSVLKDGLVNCANSFSSLGDGFQIWVGLNYSDSSLSSGLNSSVDVRYVTMTASASYLGSGDSSWDAEYTTFSNDDLICYSRQGIPVPATYGGKAFKGLQIVIYAGRAEANTDLAEFLLSRIALIEGDTINAEFGAYLNYPEDSVFDPIAKDLVQVQSDIVDVKDSKMKFPGLEKRYFAGADTLNQNALRGFNTSSAAVPSCVSDVWPAGTTCQKVVNHGFMDKYGEFCLKMSGAGAKYSPSLAILVTPEDLARIGVVPDDSTPPKISFMLSVLKDGLVNCANSFSDTEFGVQVWAGLMYSDAELSESITTTDHVRYVGLEAPAGGLGTGDSSWDTTCDTYTTDDLFSYARQGVPILSTYNGKAFKGVVVNVYAGRATENTDPAEMLLSRIALIKGDTIDAEFGAYLNYPEDGGLKTLYDDLEQAKSDIITNNEALLASELTNSMALADVDRVGFLGDSFTASHYTMPDKAYISRVSELSNFNVESIAVSGRTYTDMLDYVRQNTAVYHSSLGFSDYNCRYAVLISYSNDIGKMSPSQYLDTLRGLIETVKAKGVIPIVAAEHVNDPVYCVGMREVATEYNVPFIDIAELARVFDSKYLPFWGNGHPAARTNNLLSSVVSAHFAMLPKPSRSIKIFRPRGAVADIEDLIFDTVVERAKRWKEISVGHFALASGSEKYYDALDQAGYNSSMKVYSEYLKLQNGEAVVFGDYALIDAIIPCRKPSSLALKLSTVDLTVKVRNVLTAPFETNNRYQRYVYSGSPTVSVGDQYSDGTTTHTVLHVQPSENAIIMTTEYTEGGGGGVLTRVSGSGSATIDYTNLLCGFDEAWYVNQGVPEGHWQDVSYNASTGDYELSQIDGCVQGRKVSFLIYKAGGFSLSSLEVKWVGRNVDDDSVSDLKLPVATGVEMLNQTLVGDSEISDWTTSGTISPSMPVDTILPEGCTKKVDISDVNTIEQLVAFSATRNVRPIQIRLWARYFPTIFSYTDTYPDNAPITSDTFDYRTMRIALTVNGRNIVFERLVGLHWQDVVFDTYLPGESDALTMTVSCIDGTAEIAKASMKYI